MSISNTAVSYGSVARFFHWTTALLILTAIPLGLIAVNLPAGSDAEVARKVWLFSIHKTVGVAVFFVALARILWAVSQIKPNPVHPERSLETRLAETVHWLLYASLVIVPLTGWIHHAALTGFAPILWPFGQSLPFVPKDQSVAEAFGKLHWLFTKVLAAAVVLHVAGALKHALVDKDSVLARMTTGAEAGPPAAAHPRSPAIFAAAIWAAAIGAGATLAMTDEGDTAALSNADSEWEVTDGRLLVTIQQLGSSSQGQFEQWTADINFNENAEGETKGIVEVSVAIPSFQLSGVMDQVFQPDFFNAEQHPTATFSADIVEVSDGYEARGTLTIKDVTSDLVLPFTLNLEDGTATAQGSTRLDRRTFEIGTETYPDENNLGFPVDITFDLTAVRGD